MLRDGALRPRVPPVPHPGVGVLVAEATRKPLADYLSEKIWRPYGMERDAEWMIDDVGHEQDRAATLRGGNDMDLFSTRRGGWRSG